MIRGSTSNPSVLAANAGSSMFSASLRNGRQMAPRWLPGITSSGPFSSVASSSATKHVTSSSVDARQQQLQSWCHGKPAPPGSFRFSLSSNSATSIAEDGLGRRRQPRVAREPGEGVAEVDERLDPGDRVAGEVALGRVEVIAFPVDLGAPAGRVRDQGARRAGRPRRAAPGARRGHDAADDREPVPAVPRDIEGRPIEHDEILSARPKSATLPRVEIVVTDGAPHARGMQVGHALPDRSPARSRPCTLRASGPG